MVRLMGLVLKGLFFALLVLVAANYLRIGGRTLSDQVHTHLARAERSNTAARVRGWTSELAEDARKGARRIGNGPIHRLQNQPDQIQAGEQHQLQDLIRSGH